MNNQKHVKIITIIFLLLFIFSLGVSARTITGSETFNNLIINSGETWTVTSSGDITLTINGDFVIESGGKLTYNDSLKNSDINLIINVGGNARINGEIDFTGVQGSQGTTGSGTQSNGVGKPGGIGGQGTDGKDITLNVENGNLVISGTISTKGGKGGAGAKGKDGRESYPQEDPSVATPGGRGGDGGCGGVGGNAGKIDIKTGISFHNIQC